MQTAKIFMNGRSQAVRLPKNCRFATDEVVVARLDEMVVLYPKEKGWDLMAKGIEHFTDDMLSSRDQPERPERRTAL